jgi:RNA binding exosome subunit
VTCPVATLIARVYIHATEDPDKVIKALRNVVEGPYVLRSTRGHHGNVIHIVEVKLTECDAYEVLKSIVAKLDDVEFVLMLSGIEETRLYVKFDKQQAYRGLLKVSQGDDVIYVEVRGRSVAIDDMRRFMTSLREALKR